MRIAGCGRHRCVRGSRGRGGGPGRRGQVTGLNNEGVTVGFWSGMNNANMMNDNHGLFAVNGHFRTADFPAASPAAPPVDQLLGVNDRDVAVGFYTDANGNTDGLLATPQR